MDTKSWDESRRLEALLREASILAGIHSSVPHACAILDEEISRTRAALADSATFTTRHGESHDQHCQNTSALHSQASHHVGDSRGVHVRNISSSVSADDSSTVTRGVSLTSNSTPSHSVSNPSSSPPSTNAGNLGVGARKRIKLKVPAEKYPEYNFVGRLLGPRGATLKKLERETGCKIMIRGRGSIRKDKEADVRGKPGWEHVFQDNLHVVIEVSDAPDEQYAQRALNRAKEAVELLLVPVPEEKDSLKRQQLRDLAILNGTFRTSETAQGAGTTGAPSSANMNIGSVTGPRQNNGGSHVNATSHISSSPPQVPPLSPVLRLNGYTSNSSSGAGTPGGNIGSVHSRGVPSTGRSLPRIPTLDIESVNESFLISPSTAGSTVPARSPTIVDPDMYPFPPTPGIIGSDANGSKASFGSPIWSPMHSAPAPPPIPSPMLQNHHMNSSLSHFSSAQIQHQPQKHPVGRPPSSSPLSSRAQPDFQHQLQQQTYQHEQLHNQLHHQNPFHQGGYPAFCLPGGSSIVGDTLESSSDVGTTVPLHFSPAKGPTSNSGEVTINSDAVGSGADPLVANESRFVFSHSHFRDLSQHDFNPQLELETQFKRTHLHDGEVALSNSSSAPLESQTEVMPQNFGLVQNSARSGLSGNDEESRGTAFTNFFPNVTAGLGNTSSSSLLDH